MNHLRIVVFSFIAVLLILCVRPYRGADAAASVQLPVPARLLTLLSVHGFSHFALQAADDSQKANADDSLPEGKGKDVTKRVCSGCHAVTVFSQQRHTEDQWGTILDDMVSKGLDASDEDLETINHYLVTYLGPAKQDAPNAPPDASPAH